MAVNVTMVDAHTGFEEAAILTLTGRLGFTVIVIALDVAGLPLAHVAEDVITQVTVFPFVSELLE